MKKSVYICGPITGMPDLNRLEFNRAEVQLNALGFQAINPHVICKDIVASHEGSPEELWQKCMRNDIQHMLRCDLVVLLNGWSNSRGAMIEAKLAKDVAIPVSLFDKFMEGFNQLHTT